jgi:hypothetical protein
MLLVECPSPNITITLVVDHVTTLKGVTAKMHQSNLEYDQIKASANQRATATLIEAAGLTELHVPLKSASKRHVDERAVLVYKQRPGNSP